MSNNIVIEIADAEANYAAPELDRNQPNAARLAMQHLRVRIADASYRVSASFKYRYVSERAWLLLVPEEWESQDFEVVDWDNWSEIDPDVANHIRALVRAFFIPALDVDRLAELRAAAIDAQIASHRSAIEALESDKNQ